MSDTPKSHIIVVGAGYGGLATAIELARKGIKVTVYEAVSKLTQQGAWATPDR
jgi:phytoene dehydrogenase-like protein